MGQLDARGEKPSNARTPYDDLKLPDGRTIGEIKNITPLLIRLGVPGVESNSMGRAAAVEAYAAHLARIAEIAGRAAIDQWLADAKRNV